jgi:hypothetical protein
MSYDDDDDWDDGDLGWEVDEYDDEDEDEDEDEDDDFDASLFDDDDEPDDDDGRVCRPGRYGPFDPDEPSPATEHEDRDQRWYELYFLP